MTNFVNCGQLVTLQGSNRGRVGDEMAQVETIPGGAFTVEKGVISWVGTSENAPKENQIDLEGALVTPGLVDAHTHTIFAGDRAEEFSWRCQGVPYQEIAQRGGGIRSTMRLTREANASACGKTHQNRLIRCGTTTFETKTGYGLSPEREIDHLGCPGLTPATLLKTWLPAHAVPPEYESDAVGYLSEIVKLLPHAKKLGARAVDAFVEPGYFDIDTVRPYLQAAQRLGLKVRLHVDQLGNHGGAAFAAEMGAETADHLEYTDEEGMRVMQRAGVVPVLLPASVFGLGLQRYPEARKMIEIGLPVVLATDYNPGSSPCPSLPLTMSIACRMMRMSPEEALTACTINAAASLGLAQKKGSIEVGKEADFVCWPYKDYRELAYWFGDVMPSRIFIAGKEFFDV